MNDALEWIKPLIISPPFGSRLPSSKNYTRVVGSYTWQKRPGWLMQVARTVRPTAKGGWVNKIGLRNPGIRNITFRPDRIYSVVGFTDNEWLDIAHYLDHLSRRWIGRFAVELNLSCPNTEDYVISDRALNLICSRMPIIAKLPPTAAADILAERCMEAGVMKLHLSNTLPHPNGGESGPELFRVNLPIVQRMAKRYPGKIIAGGGVYDPSYYYVYKEAGAWRVSVASVLFTPWKFPAIVRAANK